LKDKNSVCIEEASRHKFTLLAIRLWINFVYYHQEIASKYRWPVMRLNCFVVSLYSFSL